MRCLVEDLQTKTETVLLILVTNNGRGKLPTPPPPPPVRNLTTEKNSLSTRKKPINDLSIIIIESKK